jgi:hypothetical protein
MPGGSGGPPDRSRGAVMFAPTAAETGRLSISIPPSMAPGGHRLDPSTIGEGIAAAFRDHSSAIYGKALRSTRDPELAADVTQEAFLRLVVEAQAGRLPDNIGGWLYRTSANLIVSRARRAAVARRLAPPRPVRWAGRAGRRGHPSGAAERTPGCPGCALGARPGCPADGSRGSHGPGDRTSARAESRGNANAAEPRAGTPADRCDRVRRARSPCGAAGGGVMSSSLGRRLVVCGRRASAATPSRAKLLIRGPNQHQG